MTFAVIAVALILAVFVVYKSYRVWVGDNPEPSSLIWWFIFLCAPGPGWLFLAFIAVLGVLMDLEKKR